MFNFKTVFFFLYSGRFDTFIEIKSTFVWKYSFFLTDFSKTLMNILMFHNWSNELALIKKNVVWKTFLIIYKYRYMYLLQVTLSRLFVRNFCHRYSQMQFLNACWKLRAQISIKKVTTITLQLQVHLLSGYARN